MVRVRRIDLTPLASRSWNLWLAACRRATTALSEAAERGETLVIDKVYRRLSIRKAFFFNEGPPFYRKCVYCERRLVLLDGVLDHFRPKLGITSNEDEPILDMDDEGQPSLDEAGFPKHHPGYYWLAYDWRNLLPCCRECNQPNRAGSRKIGKGNLFPVEGRHARNAKEIADEKPLLIHPASGNPDDDPELHFKVNTNLGLLVGRTARGKACIEVFGLNHRDTLRQDRQSAIRDARWLILSRDRDGNAEAAQILEEIEAGKRPFTLAQLAVLREASAGRHA